MIVEKGERPKEEFRDMGRCPSKWVVHLNNGDFVAFAPSLRLAVKYACQKEKP